MKNFLIPAITGLLISASVHAQSTVDSIEAKYKLLPMPQGGTTLEKTFPILGTYQLNSGMNASTTTSSTTSTDASSTTSSSNMTNNVSNGGNTVTVTLDSSNKGIVWIDGLPEGKMRAYLKKSPATYRIVAQKTSTGKEIPEGTMVYNPDNNTLNISIGAPYNEADPTAIFNVAATTSNTDLTNSGNTPASGTHVKVKSKNGTVKTKNKVLFYTASKSITTSSSNAAQQ